MSDALQEQLLNKQLIDLSTNQTVDIRERLALQDLSICKQAREVFGLNELNWSYDTKIDQLVGSPARPTEHVAYIRPHFSKNKGQFDGVEVISYNTGFGSNIALLASYTYINNGDSISYDLSALGFAEVKAGKPLSPVVLGSIQDKKFIASPTDTRQLVQLSQNNNNEVSLRGRLGPKSVDISVPMNFAKTK